GASPAGAPTMCAVLGDRAVRPSGPPLSAERGSSTASRTSGAPPGGAADLRSRKCVHTLLPGGHEEDTGWHCGRVNPVTRRSSAMADRRLRGPETRTDGTDRRIVQEFGP